MMRRFFLTIWTEMSPDLFAHLCVFQSAYYSAENIFIEFL